MGGQIAVCEAARNLVATGAQPLAITDCLNFGNPKDPEIFYEIKESARGIGDACSALKTPVVSGNVSLNNETNGHAIMPTPMIGMVGLIEDLSHITSSHFKTAGDVIYTLGATHADFNGSELQNLECERVSGKLFAFDLEAEMRNQELILRAIKDGFVSACTDVSEGGLAVALSECCFEHGVGATVTLDMHTPCIFAETQSRFVLSVPADKRTAFEQAYGAQFKQVGYVTEEAELRITTLDEQLNVPVDELKCCWEKTISRHM